VGRKIPCQFGEIRGKVKRRGKETGKENGTMGGNMIAQEQESDMRQEGKFER